jgi:calcium load-activated calcium channel
LKQYIKDFTQSKMTNSLLVAVLMMAFMTFFSNAFSGIVVAKLPFHPISMVQSLSHRSLEGEDMTDCSMIFIYILSNMSIRPIISKVLGFGGPRIATQQQNIFGA